MMLQFRACDKTLGQIPWGLRYPVHAPSSICRIVIGNTPPGLNLIGDRSRAGIPDAAASRMPPHPGCRPRHH